MMGGLEVQAQSPSRGSNVKIEMAGLRSRLVWQRSSPKPGAVEGPVLYQLLFSAAGTSGTLAKFDTNPRHLTNSLITDDGSMVAVGGLSISSAGMITFANGQTFPGTGTVTSVDATAGITGGPITGSGTLSLDTAFTNNLYAQLAAANTFTTGTQLIQTGAAGTVGLAVKGASAQTANLEEWRNNADTAVASVSASGVFSGDGSGLANLSGSQLTDGGINRQQIALLKWYAAIQSASFTVGTQPVGVAFDGANIWVTSVAGVSKLRASDGACVGVCVFSLGNNPTGVAFDGANIWVANTNDNTVSKVRASDGSMLGPFIVGTGPKGVAFDGANIWVANFGSNNVSKLRASDGACVGTCTFAVGAGPFALAFDGANIWVVNQNSSNVSKLRASDGTVLGTFAVGGQPSGVAFDGANIWVTNAAGVSKLRASDGACVGTCLFAVGNNPYGVAFDGANIWVVNQNSNNVSKLRASDGAVLGTFAVGSFPRGVAFDGANIWVANFASGTVSKL
jgi:hypothetical protein